MSATAFLVFLVFVHAAQSSTLSDCSCGQFTKGQQLQLQKILKAEAGSLRSEMAKMCPRSTEKWYQLNRDGPICFGASGDNFGELTMGTGGFLAAVKLVHKSGYVTCDTACSNGNCNTNWGCPKSHQTLGNTPMGTLVTTESNRILFPCHDHLAHNAPNKWYALPDFEPNSPVLVFSDFQHPTFVQSNQKLRLWYGEDLDNTDEDNNDGKTCADVFAWFI